MKKLLSLFAIILFFGSLAITSCNSSSTVCPAYPPSVYHGDANIQNADIETATVVDEKNL